MFINILYILYAILILSFIVMAHELGHFIAGRLCGIGVVEFAIGFGPRVLGFSRKGTQYSLRLIPLGGFCRFVGEDEDNNDPTAMNNQPVYKRAITIAAGPAMNFILAFIVALILFWFYAAKPLPVIQTIYEGQPAHEAGLEVGDAIRSINGMDISYDYAGVVDIQTLVVGTEPGGTIEMIVERGGEMVTIPLNPRLVTSADGTQQYQIGILFLNERIGFFEAFPEAAAYMIDSADMMLDAIKNLVLKGEGASEVMGTVGIISFVSETVRGNSYMLFVILFVISLNLGIMNLLPLPALDGGRLAFLLVEAIRRKPVPPEKEGIVHGIGFLLLLGLIVVLTYQDIMRLITRT